MKYYDNRDNFYERIHTVEVTLQSGEYKGTFQKVISGNCFGNQVLTFFSDFNDEITQIINNQAELEFNEDDDGNYWYKCYLTNEEGGRCEIENEIEELQNIVVKLEIIDCKVDK